jgi:hypothetical protein
MSLDDVLFGVIIAGVGLCAAHFRGEYIRWREHGAAERRKETSMRELHIHRLSLADPHHQLNGAIPSHVKVIVPPAYTARGETPSPQSETKSVTQR